LSSGSGDAVLKRVTMVAAHPDATLVYLQADYASPAAPSRGAARSFEAASPGTWTLADGAFDRRYMGDTG
jgi:hypothetical protein